MSGAHQRRVPTATLEPASELHPRAWVIWPRDHGFFRRLLAISVSHPCILGQEELTVYPPVPFLPWM